MMLSRRFKQPLIARSFGENTHAAEAVMRLKVAARRGPWVIASYYAALTSILRHEIDYYYAIGAPVILIL